VAIDTLGGQQEQNREQWGGRKIYGEVGSAAGWLPGFDEPFFRQNVRQRGQLEAWEGDSGGENHGHV